MFRTVVDQLLRAKSGAGSYSEHQAPNGTGTDPAHEGLTVSGGRGFLVQFRGFRNEFNGVANSTC